MGLHLLPCAENQASTRQYTQHVRLHRAHKSRRLALRGNKIEPAPAIEGVKGQSKHLVGDRVGFAKVIKEPAIKVFALQRLLDSIEVHSDPPLRNLSDVDIVSPAYGILLR